MKNILTIDCEDWYHTRTIQKYLGRQGNLFLKDRISSNVHTLLDLFSLFNSRGTFFVLGKVAEKFPELIPKIENRGHRVGAHGYKHADLFSMKKENFESDVRRVSDLINKMASRPVQSF